MTLMMMSVWLISRIKMHKGMFFFAYYLIIINVILRFCEKMSQSVWFFSFIFIFVLENGAR